MRRVRKKNPVSGELPKTGEYISTLEAAKLCGVSTFSVQRWFDEGLLVGARLPGGKRRIEVSSLRRFMIDHNMIPTEQAIANQVKILVSSSDAKLISSLKEVLASTSNVVLRSASSGLDTGLSLSEFKPDAVIIDVTIEDMPIEALLSRIRKSQVGRSVKIVALVKNDSEHERRHLKTAGATAVVLRTTLGTDLLKALGLPS